jgi:hypothetical protein
MYRILTNEFDPMVPVSVNRRKETTATIADLNRLGISIPKTAYLLDCSPRHVYDLLHRGVLRRLTGVGGNKITTESVKACLPMVPAE